MGTYCLVECSNACCVCLCWCLVCFLFCFPATGRSFLEAMTAQTPAGAPSLNLRVLLEEVIERGASDLHITAGERPMLRVDGDMPRSSNEVVLQPKDTLQLAYTVLA